MPVSAEDSQNKVARFDGPPRVVALGFQVSHAKLIGPTDLFPDPSFDRSREIANSVAEYMRLHDPFMPYRLGPEEMEYTTLPQVLEKLKDRFRKV